MTYTMIHNGDGRTAASGRRSEKEAGIPPNWLPYFAVEQRATTRVAKAVELGGRALVGTA